LELGCKRLNQVNVPPFFEADGAVAIRVHLGKKHIELAAGNGQARATKGKLELLPGELPVVVDVYGFEEPEELHFCLLDKCAELFTTNQHVNRQHSSRGV
jgi:hypothetical protein